MVVVYELDDQDDCCASAGARKAKTNAIMVARNVDERILEGLLVRWCVVRRLYS